MKSWGYRRTLLCLLALCLLPCATSVRAQERVLDAVTMAQAIDRLMEEHWRGKQIVPAKIAADSALFRRVILDLTGRIPSAAEVIQFQAKPAPERFAETVQRLLAGPEFSWYFASTLDDSLQGPLAGNTNFVGYLRRSLKTNKPWDQVFREVMLGPWDNDDRKGAVGFLDRRAKDIDRLTADVARSFFGVDISCARCHNHPLVKDWKRDHYYGMAAFLVRTTGGKGAISEKADGEARFAGKDGKERIAPMMFLTGRIVAEPPKPAKAVKGEKFNRREQLVRVALEDKTFLSRAFVNRTWEYFFGKGLVDPVDQIHSGNPAAIPSVLDYLAEDFVASGYDVRRLVAGIVLTKAYRLDSRWAGEPPQAVVDNFAVGRLRPLSPLQMANSLLIALGTGTFEPTPENLKALEKQAGELMPKLDPRTRDFQSSTREALFLSNSDIVRKLFTADGESLTSRLTRMKDADMVKAAFVAILSRPPTDAEIDRIIGWVGQSNLERSLAIDSVVWALATSAEFRFNH